MKNYSNLFCKRSRLCWEWWRGGGRKSGFFLCSWAKPFLGTLWKLLCRWCVIGGAWGDWDVTGFLKAVSHWERQRKVSERERVLACSAFENFYNLQFSCNLQEHIFQQKNSRSLISTTLQPTLPFFFFFFLPSFYLCFAFASRIVLGIILLLSLFAQIRFC